MNVFYLLIITVYIRAEKKRRALIKHFRIYRLFVFWRMEWLGLFTVWFAVAGERRKEREIERETECDEAGFLSQ